MPKNARYAVLPRRKPGKGILETNPESWQVRLIGRVKVPQGFDCDWETATRTAEGKVKSAVRRISNDKILAVFQCRLSKRVFYWVGTRGNCQLQLLEPPFDATGDKCRYSHWPTEYYSIGRSNFKAFCHFVYGFGCEYDLNEEQQEEVDKQKKKLVGRLKEMYESRG